MKIKKLGRCCLIIEENGKRIMTDPGKYTISFQNEEKNIDYIFITHEHTDHVHVDSLKIVLKNNPYAVIITNVSVGKILEKEKIRFSLIKDSQEMVLGENILIEGVGKLHKQVYQSIPAVENVGFILNKRFFYPGDALSKIEKKVNCNELSFPIKINILLQCNAQTSAMMTLTREC